jgi:hypothetical protein
VNESDADMGTVTETAGGDYRPWTVIVAAGLFWLLATGLAGAGVWGIVQATTGGVDSGSAAVGVIATAWALAAYQGFIGLRLFHCRNVIAQALFMALLWLPVGHFLREAAHPVLGLSAWGLAVALAAMLLAPATRRAVGFGEHRPFGE